MYRDSIHQERRKPLTDKGAIGGLSSMPTSRIPLAVTPTEAISGRLTALSMRSYLLQSIKTEVRSWNITRPQAARRLGISADKLDALLSDNLAGFSLNELIEIAPRTGLAVQFSIASIG